MSQQAEFNWSNILVRSSLFLLLVVAIIQFFNILYSDVNALPLTLKKNKTASNQKSEEISEPADSINAPALLTQPKIELVEADPIYENKKTIESKEIQHPLVGQQQ